MNWQQPFFSPFGVATNATSSTSPFFSLSFFLSVFSFPPPAMATTGSLTTLAAFLAAFAAYLAAFFATHRIALSV
jgi:hypothetical protein